MSDSIRFARYLIAAALGAFLDYLVGLLTNKLSWGIACWAAIVLVASALLDFFSDSPGNSPQSGGNGILDAIRWRLGPFRRPSVLKAVMAGALAAVGSCAFTLAVITFRFCNAHGDSLLGKNSQFDYPVITFVSKFQDSSTTAWLALACVGLACFVPWKLVVLPVGVAAVSVANALFVGIPTLSLAGGAWYSQFAYSLGSLDQLLFRLPPVVVAPACLIPAIIGAAACVGISKLLS